MKYIDAEKLIAEIERRMDILKPHHGQGIILTEVLKDHYNDLLSFITSLQQEQPEVDLEKELAAYKDFHGDWWGRTLDGRNIGDCFDFSDIEEFASQFYELGLNARKEE